MRRLKEQPENKIGHMVKIILKCSNDGNDILERLSIFEEIAVRFLHFRSFPPSSSSFFFFLLKCLALWPGGVVCLFVPLVSDIRSTAGPERWFSSYAAVYVSWTLCPHGTRLSLVALSLSLFLSAAPAGCFLSMFSRCVLLFWWPAARQPPIEPPCDPLHLADVDVKAAALTHETSCSLTLITEATL